MSEMPFSVDVRSVSLCSLTSSGVTSCSLIYSSIIFTSYLNFISGRLFFESLIARPNFVTISVGDSSSWTFMSGTVLQDFAMTSSSYFHF